MVVLGVVEVPIGAIVETIGLAVLVSEFLEFE